MGKILIIGNPKSPLIRERALIGQQGDHKIFWVSSQEINLPDVTAINRPKIFNFYSKRGNILIPIPFLILSAIRSIQPDLIHVHYAYNGLTNLALLNFHPCIVTIMGGDILPDQDYKGITARLTRILLNHADCITSKSDYLDNALCKIGNYKKKIQRITWGVNLNKFRPDLNVDQLRLHLSIPFENLVFFDPRTAKSFYNKHIILTAFANYLKNGGPPATLLISELNPDPNYISKLKHDAHCMGINDHVRFIGSIKHNKMPDYYVLSDITIMVPPSDGLPQTIYEALACGSFLIVGDLPQYKKILTHGITAYKVLIGDETALSAAIYWSATHPEVRQQAVKIGREYVKENADATKQAKLLNNIYARTINQKS